MIRVFPNISIPSYSVLDLAVQRTLSMCAKMVFVVAVVSGLASAIYVSDSKA